MGRPNTWTEVWPFLAAGIPGINVSTFTGEFDRTEYHTQYDTAETVDFDYLAKLAEVCGRFLLEADAGAADALDFTARARHLRRAGFDDADELQQASGRERFTAVGRALHGLDAREAARYPHEQTASDVALLERGLEQLRDGERSAAARTLSRVGLNWLCSDLGREAFAIEHARRGRHAPRACWGALGDPDTGPDLWVELASLRGEPGAREPGPWLEESLARHLDRSRAELERRLSRMAEAVRGRIFPLPEPRKDDLPA
jgi:hypothetical protein